MNTFPPPAKFLVEPYELRKAGTILLTSIAMIEASHASRAGRPVAFLYGQALLAPLVKDLVHLANACVHTAGNYESCEAALTPKFLAGFEQFEPLLVKAAAAVALAVETGLGGGETPVVVTQSRVTGGSASAAAGINGEANALSALVHQLGATADAREISVEVSTHPDGRQFKVFIPGTENWQPLTSSNAFDLTSDLAAMAGPGVAAPERAVIKALKQLGFGTQHGDSILLTGYSEGGLVGANLIASGAVTALGGSVAGLVAVGSPISSSHLPAATRVISIEHVNDPVTRLDLSDARPTNHWFKQKLDPVGLLGHSLAGYRGSIDGLGAAETTKLSAELEQMQKIDAGASEAKTYWFHVKRS